MGSGKSRLVELYPPNQRRMWHEVSLRHSMGAVTLDASFSISSPWAVLFGPSGSGKTTILRIIAGLEQPDAGRIVSWIHFPPMEERQFVLTDTSSKIAVPTHRRVIRMVAQRPALFPHKTVLENILYRMIRGWRDEEERSASQQRIEEIFALCRVGHLRDKMPSELSGGERQRVALARTIAAGTGRLLLLDEPFTGLEDKLRTELMEDLRTWVAKRATPVLMVTHDVGDAFTANSEVIRIDEGRVIAQGPVAEVLAEERQRLIAVLGA